MVGRNLERALGARRGGLEVLSLGACSTSSSKSVRRLGSSRTYAVSTWNGPLAIGHTRLSTESRIDLSHSRAVLGARHARFGDGPQWSRHQLSSTAAPLQQIGVTFYTDNDSEVIGVYLRERMMRGRSLPEAMADSVAGLDGAFDYLVASPAGLGVVRDRFGFKPLMLAATDEFVAVATEDVHCGGPWRLSRRRASGGRGPVL